MPVLVTGITFKPKAAYIGKLIVDSSKLIRIIS